MHCVCNNVSLVTTLLGDIVVPPIGPALGTESDANIWSNHAPWARMLPKELCISDCAYSELPGIVAPFWETHNRILLGRTKLYNDIHSYYRGRGEHFFRFIPPTHFALMRHSRDRRGPTGHQKLLNRVRLSFRVPSFHLHHRLRYEVYGPLPAPGDPRMGW